MAINSTNVTHKVKIQVIIGNIISFGKDKVISKNGKYY